MKLSDVVVLEIPLFYPRFDTNEVDMEIVWKDTMFEDATCDSIKKNRERNEKVLNMMEKRFGKFPKTFKSYQHILIDMMEIPKEYKNIVIVFTHKEKVFIVMNTCSMTTKIIDRSIELYSKQADMKKEIEKLIKNKKCNASILKKLF